ncbi:DNA adenine methylase [Micromonospora aurantiaca]|uniref:DNA adenine methylase n=1 Tax=Micromonospora aurantiaca (nom. illeg.) TaxID=47850 RepID=UPI00343F027E
MTAPHQPLPPPVPYYGAKGKLAPQIVRLLPGHEHYVEPFCGSLAVLLAKPPSLRETVNDLDGDLVTFWRVLRDRPADLEQAVRLTPHARAEHELTYQPAADELETARRVFVKLTQGRAGQLTRTGWRYRVNTDTDSIQSRLDAFRKRIDPAAQRLWRVSLECMPALDIIDRYDHPKVLFYVDPPYLADTRAGTGYRHEMPHPEQHRELAAALRQCRAAVVLSGYPSELYDQLYTGWYVEEIATQTAQGGAGKATREVLWSNRPLGGRIQTTLWE